MWCGGKNMWALEGHRFLARLSYCPLFTWKTFLDSCQSQCFFFRIDFPLCVCSFFLVAFFSVASHLLPIVIRFSWPGNEASTITTIITFIRFNRCFNNNSDNGQQHIQNKFSDRIALHQLSTG